MHNKYEPLKKQFGNKYISTVSFYSKKTTIIVMSSITSSSLVHLVELSLCRYSQQPTISFFK